MAEQIWSELVTKRQVLMEEGDADLQLREKHIDFGVCQCPHFCAEASALHERRLAKKVLPAPSRRVRKE